jgi:hypothetical protein
MKSYQSIVLIVAELGMDEWGVELEEELVPRIQRNNMARGYEYLIHGGREKTVDHPHSSGKGKEGNKTARLRQGNTALERRQSDG